MAYREKTFNADTLTDLLSTYLSHKNLEREKYYQAELKRKPTYKAFGNELLRISPSGDIEGVARTKAPTSSKTALSTLYPTGEDGEPILTKNIGGRTHRIKNNQWVPFDLEEMKGYKTKESRSESIVDYTSWRRKTADGWETSPQLKGQKPEGLGWEKGSMPASDTTTGYVNWRRKTADGWETKPMLKGEKPDAGEGGEWHLGSAPTGVTQHVTWRKKVDGIWTETTEPAGVHPGEGWIKGTATQKEYTPVTYHKIGKDGRSVGKTFKTRNAELAGIDAGWIKGPAKAPEGHITWSRLNDAGTYDRITERVGIHPGKGYFKGVPSDPKTDTPDSVQTAAKDLLRIHSEIYPGDSETKKRYTELVSGLKTKDDYNKFKLELNKEGGKWERRKTRTAALTADSMIKDLLWTMRS